MKTILLAALFTLALCYEDIYDKIEYGIFENNLPLLKRYLDCFLDKAPCVDPEALSVKPHLYEAFADSCRECTPLQKHHAHLYMKALKTLDPEGYKDFQKKYDADGKHAELLEKEIENF